MKNSRLIDTPLGLMVAIADECALLLLAFENRGPEIIPPQGQNAILDQIQQELDLYFAGKLEQFRTPLALNGTPFQKKVWEALQTIPYGETISYSQLAAWVGNPRGCRAVAQANGANRFAIIIPCHRVINQSGALGGYGGGLDRKEWLLDLENQKK